MNATRMKGLGRGLEALLGSNTSPEGQRQALLPTSVLQPGKYQPRTRMDPGSLEELADSIRAQGLIQPISVRPVGKERYEIIAGERRWRAAQIAGLVEVPVLIREVPDDAALAMSLIENIQREDLNPLEEALALQRLSEEFHLTQQQAADAVGKSRVAVTNLLRLLNLAPPVREMLAEGELEMGHARALLSLSPLEQEQAARQVVTRGLSVRQTEALVRQRMRPTPLTPIAAVRRKDPDTARLEVELSERIGAPVSINFDGKSVGTVVIRYSSVDELEGILTHLR